MTTTVMTPLQLSKFVFEKQTALQPASPLTPAQTVIEAVKAHPHTMSPLLLEYLLRGEDIGRMREKGLTDSRFFGCLAHIELGAVANLIADALDSGKVCRSGGFYPALIAVD